MFLLLIFLLTLVPFGRGLLHYGRGFGRVGLRFQAIALAEALTLIALVLILLEHCLLLNFRLDFCGGLLRLSDPFGVVDFESEKCRLKWSVEWSPQLDCVFWVDIWVSLRRICRFIP